MNSRVLGKLAKDLRFFVQEKRRSKRAVWVEARDEGDLLYLKEEVIPDLGLELVSVQPQIGMLVVRANSRQVLELANHRRVKRCHLSRKIRMFHSQS